MEEDLCSSDQRKLTAELTKKMSSLTYSPNPLGPREYFRVLTKYQHQINLLPAMVNMTAAQMIDYSHLAFARSKHDPYTLHRVEDNWKVHRAAVGADTNKVEFSQFKKFWGRRLKELYSSYHSESNSANMVNVRTDRRITDLEDTLKELVSVFRELRSQAETATATAASTLTMSNHQLETALSALTSKLNLLVANQQQAQAGSQPQPRSQQPQRGGRYQRTGSSIPYVPKWKQYKHYCHSCGVNLSHDGRDCIRFKPNHQAGATFTNRMGGSNRRENRWMKWSHPVTRETHDAPPLTAWGGAH